MEALVCAFSELRIREDAVSLTLGCPGSADTPPNIYEGGLGARRQQCPSPPGSKPKNFRLRHLRSLALYLPSSMQPAGQCESHWLGRLMAGGCLPRPKGGAWALDLSGPLSSTNHPLDSPGPQPPRENLGSTGPSPCDLPTMGLSRSEAKRPILLPLRSQLPAPAPTQPRVSSPSPGHLRAQASGPRGHGEP
ncbi:uncharacterized protein C16orf90 homolog isoform X1 [Macrotis lagotis]|uniref:uncharacterized protein C16orf90 homolog isoform X1 n=1 Tax=Macrotis lagotis TaxID=92651 RepID=UPI003D69B2D8